MDLFNYVMQTPQNTNPAVLSSEISKAVEESQVQADYAQNDPNAKDYIKNRPFYGKKGTRLRNTYEDWAAAGGDDGSRAKPILSFIINDEIYENITPNVYNGGYTKVYNIPSLEQPKYKVIAYVQNRRIICTLGGSSKEIENWSIYPPEETEEIHYLDPKYIKGGGVFIIDENDPDYSTSNTAYGNKVKEALLSGKSVWVYSFVEYTTNDIPYERSDYLNVTAFTILKDDTDSTGKLDLFDVSQGEHHFTITVD